MRFRILFQFCVLAEFIWNCSSRSCRVLPHYCQEVEEVQVDCSSAVTQVQGQERAFSLLLGGAGGPGFHPHPHQSSTGTILSGNWRRAAPHVAFSETIGGCCLIITDNNPSLSHYHWAVMMKVLTLHCAAPEPSQGRATLLLPGENVTAPNLAFLPPPCRVLGCLVAACWGWKPNFPLAYSCFSFSFFLFVCGICLKKNNYHVKVFCLSRLPTLGSSARESSLFWYLCFVLFLSLPEGFQDSGFFGTQSGVCETKRKLWKFTTMLFLGLKVFISPTLRASLCLFYIHFQGF